MGLNRMEAFIDPDNTASRRLVERAGFRPEGLLKERYQYGESPTDAFVYRLLANEYSADVPAS